MKAAIAKTRADDVAAIEPPRTSWLMLVMRPREEANAWTKVPYKLSANELFQEAPRRARGSE